MSIRARNVHFSNWAKVVEALSEKGVTDKASAKTFLASSTNNPFYYSVCYIRDTKEIYTHGQFYSCSAYNDSEIRQIIANLETAHDARLDVLEATALEFDALVEEVAENELVTAKALSDLNNNKVERTELPDFEKFASTDDIRALESAMTSINASNITSGTISLERLPQGALERLFVTASESTAMSLDIQNGDVVKVTGNNGKMYFCSNETATTFATKFTEFTAGSATSVPWSGVTGKPDLATQAELDVVDAKFDSYLSLSGGTLTGNLTAPQIKCLLAPQSTHGTSAAINVTSTMRFDTLMGGEVLGSGKSTGYNNAILSISRYSNANYTTQLGFSGIGTYVRIFNDKAPDTTTPWQKFIVDDGNGNVYIPGTLNTDLLKVDSDASVIGNLNVSGTLTTDLINCNSDISAYGFYEKSDERLKTFSDSVEVNLDKLSSLRKSHFTYNDDESKKQHIGVSAQEVQKLYPEVVNEDEDGYLSVDYAKLSVIALKAVDELYSRLLKLEAKINA